MRTRLRLTGTLVTLLVVLGVGLMTPGYAAGDPVGRWPLRPVPEVVAGFDPPATTWGAGHRGVDLLGSQGRRVRAALPGTVSFVGPIAGRGVVVVDHGDTRTTYEPVTASVRRGETVAAGDVIGRLGTIGSHCSPRACLHWGWIRGDTYLDPLRLVGAGPVRLLPLDGQPATLAASPAPYAGWRPFETLAQKWVEEGAQRPSRNLARQEPPLLRLLRPGIQP